MFVVVELDVLGAWCRRHLSAGIQTVLFRGGYFSDVVAVELNDGRSVVVKARPSATRLSVGFAVHEHLFKHGFPCAEPLAGPQPYGSGRVATAEAYVPPADGIGTAEASAALLARLILTAQTGRALDAGLAPPPAWVHWQHDGRGLWPTPDDHEVDLNAVDVPWIDEFGARARDVLLAAAGPRVIAHADWVPQNVWWNPNGTARAVLDWDSLAVLPEPAAVGVAAAIRVPSASADQTEAFLGAYQRAASTYWSPAERRVAPAAAMWARLFDSKQDLLAGRHTPFGPDDAEELAQLASDDR